MDEERERERQDREGEEENGEGAVEAVEEGGRGDGGAGEHAGAVADRASEHERELGVRRVVVVELAQVVPDVGVVEAEQAGEAEAEAEAERLPARRHLRGALTQLREELEDRDRAEVAPLPHLDGER